MKVSKIEIKDFHQFKDFTLDLTYPAGHEKAGQPLDKICFIGQSGTGKTTLLELVQLILFEYPNRLYSVSNLQKLVDNFELYVSDKTDEFNIKFSKHKQIIASQKMRRGLVQARFAETVYNENIDEFKKKYLGNYTIYFPANLNYELLEIEENSEIDSFIDFSEYSINNVMNLINKDIVKFNEKELQIRQDISKIVENSSKDIEAIQRELKKLEDWKKDAFNPIEDIADNCLNILLAPFKLRVKTKFEFKTKDDIGFIKIEDYNGNEIPMGLWSTGTKQVVLSAMPLYLLKPKYSFIFFDEPERSLYPDLQRMIIDFYTGLTDNCQFMFATHSPIIASSFDPWEIVELKFDKNFKVYREQYYEGENHVDNYKWNPKYMRWDDILQRVFDMENDGSEERRKKLDDLATQNVKLRKLTKDGKQDTPEGKVIVSKVQKLAKELSVWD